MTVTRTDRSTPGARSSSRGGAVSAVAVRLAAAVLLAIAGVLAPARAPVAAAASGPGLVLTTATTYAVAPAAGVVHVTIDVSAKNTKPNRVSGNILTRYFYDGARLAIQSEATHVAAREGGTRLTTKVDDASGYAVLDVRFRSSLFYNQTAKIRVTYDLPSGKPRSLSDIRVGTAFVTFVAWAFGDRASVRVVIPSSFDAEATGADATRSTSGSSTVFGATNITDIGAWFLQVNADRKAALTNERVDLVGGEHLVIRAWPEDTEWADRVRDLLTHGLPELVEQTGLDWPISGDINVFEVHTPLLEGYSGQFYPGQNRIEISEDLDNLTIVHEASHAWFNNQLWLSRWINEGFADTYAAETLHQIGDSEWQPETVSPTDPDAVKLDAWVHPGRITSPAVDAQEQYGYNASWTVIRSLFVEIGAVQMRHVLSAAEHHQIAYQGVGEPETVGSTNDWHRLLDLVEEIGKSKTADALFRRWVLSKESVGALDARAAARTAYTALVTAGADWRPPFYVRGPMSDWQFDEAQKRIKEASDVLAKRDRIATLAAALGLTPPARLRDDYQTAKDSLQVANGVATAEVDTLDALTAATAAVGAPRDPFATIGLIGEQPEAVLAAARDAFSAAAPDAQAKAAAVTALMDGAVAIGRERATSAAVVAGVVLLLLLLIVLFLVRRRRRRRRRLALAAAAASPAGLAEAPFGPRPEELAPTVAVAEPPVEPAPYATLADPVAEPEPPPAEDVGDAP